MAHLENPYSIVVAFNETLGRHRYDPTSVRPEDFLQNYERILSAKGLQLRPEMVKAIKDQSIPHVCLRGVLGLCATTACQDCREIKSAIAPANASNYGKEFQPVKLSTAAAKKKAAPAPAPGLSLSAANRTVKTVGAKPGSKSAVRAAKGEVKVVERKPRQIKPEVPAIISASLSTLDKGPSNSQLSLTTTTTSSTKKPVYGSKVNAVKKATPTKDQQTIPRSKSAKKEASRASKANKFGSKTSCSKPSAKKAAPRRKKGVCVDI